MLSGLGSFLATVTGKVVLGGAVAAASVGGLHAGDVVDVPALPDNDPPAAEQAGAQGNGDDGDAVADAKGENGAGTEGESEADGEGITADNVGEHAALFGLCNAWEANEDGRDDGDADEADPFQALQDAADAEGQSVEEFCEGVEPSNGQGEGVNGADAADAKGENGETNSQDARENGNAPDEVPPSEAGSQGDDEAEERSTTSTSQDASSNGDDADSNAGDADDEGDEASADQRPDEVPPSDAGGSGPS